MTKTHRGAAVEFDRNGFAVLDRDGCLDLVAAARLGRLGVTRSALPLILPVAFGLIDGAPVFRVGPGAVRDAAKVSAVCCFEVDGAGDDWSWAWSVSIIGPVTLIDDPELRWRAGELALPTWSAPASRSAEYARIEPTIVSGRWYG